MEQLAKLPSSISQTELRIRKVNYYKVVRPMHYTRQSSCLSSERQLRKTNSYAASFDVFNYPSKPNMNGTPKRPMRQMRSKSNTRSPLKKVQTSKLLPDFGDLKQSFRMKLMDIGHDNPLRTNYTGPIFAKHTPVRRMAAGNDIHSRESNPGYSRKPSDGGFYLH